MNAGQSGRQVKHVINVWACLFFRLISLALAYVTNVKLNPIFRVILHLKKIN